MKHAALLVTAALLTARGLCARADDGPKVSIAPTARILMDGALYASPDKENFKEGAAIPDTRLGVKAVYGEWSAKIEVGFAYGKVGLKDIYVTYGIDGSNTVSAGSFIHQYGLQSATGSSMKCTYAAPLSDAVFNSPRQIGLMYVHNTAKFLGTFSAHVEPQSTILTPNQLGQEGYGLLSRLVGRAVNAADGTVAQAGISGGFTTPCTGDDKHSTFALAANFPSDVCKIPAIGVTMDNAMNQWKFTPELLLSKGPVALEAQYYYNRVNFRKGLHSWTGQGAYATLRGLLTGGHYNYDMYDGCLATPGKGSCELVIGYNFTSLNDKKAEYIDSGKVLSGLYGGCANSLSATLSYYINRYMLARLNYTYTHTYNQAKINTDLNAFQVRLQVIF